MISFSDCWQEKKGNLKFAINKNVEVDEAEMLF